MHLDASGEIGCRMISGQGYIFPVQFSALHVVPSIA